MQPSVCSSARLTESDCEGKENLKVCLCALCVLPADKKKEKKNNNKKNYLLFA